MTQLGLKITKYLLIFLIITSSSIGCQDIIDSQIPDVPVYLTIDLNILNELTIGGNSRYFPNFGYGGVIVTCETAGVYYAYDAACTNEITQRCKVKISGLLGTCECCDSEYFLINEAYPISGPAAAPLKQYQVSKVNSFTLRVYN